MLKVFLIGHDYEYEVKELLKLFYDADALIIYSNDHHVDLEAENLSEDIIINKLIKNRNETTIITEAYISGEKNKTIKTVVIDGNLHDVKRKTKQLIKSAFFQLLIKYNKVYLPWGFLTGIRPTKIVHELLNEGKSQEEITYILTKDYYISKAKAQLLLEVANIEHKYVYPIDEKKVSIYISIPFCPTRCSYCSFPSNPLDRFHTYIEDYIEAICKEIKGTSEILNRKGKEIETVYIGGGTPTTLNTRQFQKIFDVLVDSFDISKLKEFTVEAGRPDTVDTEKLIFLKKSGVTRISINPQTMNDCTLKKIGRNHSVIETVEAYQLARKIGFDHINMDIIIGLPGENIDMIHNTMKAIKKLLPSNLTVHTLAIKNASRLKEQQYSTDKKNSKIVKMLEITENYARDMGLKPYYMYRQKHMVENLENIGYAKPGYECIYNIQIMEEKQTIIAMGAGAVSKIVFPKENRLERVPNIKNLELYIERVDEMIERKKKHL